MTELPDDFGLARMLAAQHLDRIVQVRQLHMAGLEDIGKAAFAQLPQQTVAPTDHRLHTGREGACVAAHRNGLCLNALCHGCEPDRKAWRQAIMRRFRLPPVAPRK